MAHDASSLERLFERYGPAYRWYATATVMLGTLSVVLAATIINVAVPAIMARFTLAQDEVQWLATAFLAAMTVGMLLNAWASARVGSRNAFVLAMGVFIVASLVGGLATSFGMLVAARVLQGVMAGMIQPQALVVIFQVFPVHRRGQAMGVYGMGVILGPAIAPALGGVLVDAFSWRATFFIVLPACLLAIVMAWRFLPGRIDMRRPRLDWCGLVLLSLGLVATLWALASMQRRGAGDVLLLAALFGGPALLIVFTLWERRCRQPLFDLRVFGVPGFTGGFLLSVVMGAGVFASTYLTPLYFQQVSGQSAAVAGLMLVPSGLAMALVFPLAGVLSDRAPIARVVGTGLLLFIAGTMALRAANGATATLWLVSWAVLARLGIGLMMPAVMMGSLGLLSPEMLDRGSGVISFGRQFGGALGVNLCAVLAQFASGLHAAAHPALGRSAAFEAGFDDAFLALAAVFLLAFWPLLTMRKSQRYSG